MALLVASAVLFLLSCLCNASQLAKSSDGAVLSGKKHTPPRQQQAYAPVIFEKDFTRPMSIPEEGIEAAVEVLRSGRLFRYSSTSAEASQVALAEKEFAEATGANYAIGVNSCSSAIMIALLCVGVKPGDEVLTNAFTFTAVTSTVLRLGAQPVLVDCSDRCA